MILMNSMISLFLKHSGPCFSMSRIFIDPNMFSTLWFQEILPELVESKNVFFVFGHSVKHISERSKVRQALNFFKMIGSMKSANGESRRIDVSDQDIQPLEAALSSLPCFLNCSHCDDPHIFALIYAKPTPYVFSTDLRIAKCRKVIIKEVDNRYFQFIVVPSAPVYNDHRHAIRS